jgi:N-formylglutamate amidohydrolase
VNAEIKHLTDHATDDIFNIEGITKLVFKYNRVFCDVERLHDKDEEMYKYGRGFYYTKTDDGQILRNDIDKEVVKAIYTNYHNNFTKIVQDKINKIGFATIIDCHSFKNTPFKTDLDKDLPRPDFCIGTCDYHTPKYLSDRFVNRLESLGYKVKINKPYIGTIVPLAYYLKNDKVKSVMIEVNRNLYMENDMVVPDKIINLNKILSKIITEL